MTPFTHATLIPMTEAQRHGLAQMLTDRQGISMTDALAAVDISMTEDQKAECVINDTYQVLIKKQYNHDTPEPELQLIWLSIKRLDKQPIHDWRHLQQIKNELVGPEAEAIELYPAESRLVDTANQYHLWVIPDITLRFPFGFGERIVCDDAPEAAGHKQRKFEG